jgi:hypothetical protein
MYLKCYGIFMVYKIKFVQGFEAVDEHYYYTIIPELAEARPYSYAIGKPPRFRVSYARRGNPVVTSGWLHVKVI